jgi:hypothetical protein
MRTTCAPRSTQAPAFGGLTGIAPSRRMIATCMWGVSDPLRAGRGAKKGAAKWGSLTPPLSLCSAATASRTPIPAAQSAAGVSPEAADWQEHRASFVLQRRSAPRAPRATPCVGAGGTVLPSFGSPTLFPLLESRHWQPGRGKAAVRQSGRKVLRQILGPAERQHSDARPCLVDRKERASLDVLPVRVECLCDDAHDHIGEQILSSDLHDARRRSTAGREDCREVQVVRDEDERVLVRPRQNLDV